MKILPLFVITAAFQQSTKVVKPVSVSPVIKLSGSSLENSNNLLAKLIAACTVNGVAPTLKAEGMILCGEHSKKYIQALENSTPINGVPVDKRVLCKKYLLKSLKRMPISERVSLLCHTGYRGSGKSVLQAFNSKWFVEETKEIAIVTTFNDDQFDIEIDEVVVNPLKNFRQSLAVKILHRLLEHFIGAKAKAQILGISKLIRELDEPVEESLDLVRQVLGVKENVKILLCVDEIILASVMLKVPPDKLMKVLTTVLDRKSNLCLSVSAYGAIDLAKF